VALNSREETEFKASAQCHPSLLDLKDSSQITIPMATLLSLDEDSNVSIPFPFVSRICRQC